ncbi:hypothetical protein D5086_010583 [Populus alba]|uniref:Uncharacterized protein n=1 Tax=Populus alba TaxID=43335 RepID=A0ACC4CA86_POPAL
MEVTFNANARTKRTAIVYKSYLPFIRRGAIDQAAKCIFTQISKDPLISVLEVVKLRLLEKGLQLLKDEENRSLDEETIDNASIPGG